MMHGLEVRSPFLDHKLAEFVYNLPVEFKMNKNENKIILKDILSEIMPRCFRKDATRELRMTMRLLIRNINAPVVA